MSHDDTGKPNILIVDDEQHILQMLEINMKTRGFNCLTAETAEEALVLAESVKPDLILLDVMLPGMDGVEACGLLKKNPETSKIPVLMVSAKSEGQDKINGLLGGADDYITKPFSIEELFLRIKAALRQVELLTQSVPPSVLEKGSLVMDTRKFQVSNRGIKIELTLTEFRILQLMLSHQGEIVNRDVMIRTIFEVEPPEMSRTLDVHIRNIRKKMETAEVEDCEIETVRGQGYIVR